MSITAFATAEEPEETPGERAARHALNKPLIAAFRQLAEEMEAAKKPGWESLPRYTRDNVTISPIVETEHGHRCYVTYSTFPVATWESPREIIMRLDSTEKMPGYKRNHSVLINEVPANEGGKERLGRWHGAFRVKTVEEAIDATINYLNEMVIEANIRYNIEIADGTDDIYFSVSEWLEAFNPNARDWRAEWQNLLASVQRINMIISTFDKHQGMPDKG